MGTQPENTHGIQTKTQPIPKIWFGYGYYTWVPEFWVPNPHHTPHYVKVEKYQKVAGILNGHPICKQLTNEKNKNVAHFLHFVLTNKETLFKLGSMILERHNFN